MPFTSKKQKQYMFAKHPDIANRWVREYGAAIQASKKKRSEKNKRKK